MAPVARVVPVVSMVVPAALVVLLLLPIFYGLSSNGFYDLRRRLRHRR